MATSVFLAPPITDGEIAAEDPGWGDGYRFPFNAEVLPPPRVGGVSPGGGSLAGGTKVILTGSNFAEVESVTFGGQPAQFTVDSDTQLTAVVPPWPRLGPVAVTVATAAGRAEAPGGYSYEGCVVPRLKGRSLNGARKALDRRQCRLGEVKRLQGATARTGRVKRQAPLRGTVLPPGAKVKVTLGLNPKPRRSADTRGTN